MKAQIDRKTIDSTIAALKQGKVTELQLEALELFISHSLKATVRAKKLILWFLRQSDFLQRNICLTIPYKEQGTDEFEFADEVWFAVHDMSNMLFAIFNLMGLPKSISCYSGIAKKEGNLIKFETGWDGTKQEAIPMESHGFTIYLAARRCKNNFELLEFNREEVEKTKLRNTYFSISSSDTTSVVKCGDPEFYEDSEIPEKYLQVIKRKSA